MEFHLISPGVVRSTEDVCTNLWMNLVCHILNYVWVLLLNRACWDSAKELFWLPSPFASTALTPDNSFLGFVVERSRRTAASTKRTNKHWDRRSRPLALVYGKKAYMWKVIETWFFPFWYFSEVSLYKQSKHGTRLLNEMVICYFWMILSYFFQSATV